MHLPTIDLETHPAPGVSILILHGLGADGEDFVPVCQELDLSSIGPVRFVMPSAPVMPVSINGGYAMRAWYDIRQPGQGPREDEAGLRQSQAALEALIRREIDRGVPASRIVLMGFSQGGAMALMTGLRHTRTLAGIAALSGYLPLAATTESEQHPANVNTPIFMAHGQDDDVVPMHRGEQSRDHLRALGHHVDWHEYPMDHSLCLPEIRDLNAWLLSVLASA